LRKKQAETRSRRSTETGVLAGKGEAEILARKGKVEVLVGK
jgi:hypothetical protein